MEKVIIIIKLIRLMKELKKNKINLILIIIAMSLGTAMYSSQYRRIYKKNSERTELSVEVIFLD